MTDLPNLANPDYVVRVNRADVIEPQRLAEVGGHMGASRRRRAAVPFPPHLPRPRTWRPPLVTRGARWSTAGPSGPTCPRSKAVARPEAAREVRAGSEPAGDAVRLVELPARRVAYLRVQRPYRAGRVRAAVRRLVAWARARRLADGRWLGYQWDDPGIVPLDRCRYDVAVEVPEGADLDETVGEGRFGPMTVAEVDIAGPLELEARAIDWLYRIWLPSSGFAPDHQPAFEAWHGQPYRHGQAHLELSIQLPVVDARRPL